MNKNEKILLVFIFILSILFAYYGTAPRGINIIEKQKVEVDYGPDEIKALQHHLINLRSFINKPEQKIDSNFDQDQVLSKILARSENWSKIRTDEETRETIRDLCSIALPNLYGKDSIKSVVTLRIKYRGLDLKFPIKVE